MVQSPSWEANWFAASQEIPRISRNPKVHYRTHKRPPSVINCAMFPLETLPLHPPPPPRRSEWGSSSGFITVAKFIKNISMPLDVFRSFRLRKLNNGHLCRLYLWGGAVPDRDWFRYSFRGLGQRWVLQIDIQV